MTEDKLAKQFELLIWYNSSKIWAKSLLRAACQRLIPLNGISTPLICTGQALLSCSSRSLWSWGKYSLCISLELESRSRSWCAFLYIFPASEDISSCWIQETITYGYHAQLIPETQFHSLGKFSLWSTSWSSRSLGMIRFMQCITSNFSSEVRYRVIHGKKSSSSMIGTLHIYCHTSWDCSSEVNFCISKGKTCIDMKI